jgi:hypothetical protein
MNGATVLSTWKSSESEAPARPPAQPRQGTSSVSASTETKTRIPTAGTIEGSPGTQIATKPAPSAAVTLARRGFSQAE